MQRNNFNEGAYGEDFLTALHETGPGANLSKKPFNCKTKTFYLIGRSRDFLQLIALVRFSSECSMFLSSEVV